VTIVTDSYHSCSAFRQFQDQIPARTRTILRYISWFLHFLYTNAETEHQIKERSLPPTLFINHPVIRQLITLATERAIKYTINKCIHTISDISSKPPKWCLNCTLNQTVTVSSHINPSSTFVTISQFGALEITYYNVVEFGLVIGFIEHLQIVTTSYYNAVANTHTTVRTKPFQSVVSSLVVVW
jgi:hypothetical protein